MQVPDFFFEIWNFATKQGLAVSLHGNTPKGIRLTCALLSRIDGDAHSRRRSGPLDFFFTEILQGAFYLNFVAAAVCVS